MPLTHEDPEQKLVEERPFDGPIVHSWQLQSSAAGHDHDEMHRGGRTDTLVYVTFLCMIAVSKEVCCGSASVSHDGPEVYRGSDRAPVPRAIKHHRKMTKVTRSCAIRHVGEYPRTCEVRSAATRWRMTLGCRASQLSCRAVRLHSSSPGEPSSLLAIGVEAFKRCLCG